MPILYGPSLPPVPAGLTPAEIAILREQLEEDTLQTLLVAILSMGRNIRGVSVSEYGALGGLVRDDTAAIQAAANQAVALGIPLVFEPGVSYQITSGITLGVPFVSPVDVHYGIGYNYTMGASYSASNLTAARACKFIQVEGNGATIWCNWTGAAQAAFNYAISTSTGKNNIYNGGISNLVIIGKEGMTGSPPTLAAISSTTAIPGTNHQVGVMAVLCPITLDHVTVREMDQGFLLSDCYWSYKYKCQAEHCNNNFVFLAENGGHCIDLLAVGGRNIAYTFTGQELKASGCHTEQCKTNVSVQSLDGGEISDCYWENTYSGDTDWSIMIGDTANAATNQVINLRLVNIHHSTSNGKGALLQSADVKFVGARSGSTNSKMNNAACYVKVDGYPWVFDLVASDPGAFISWNGYARPDRLPAFSTGDTLGFPNVAGTLSYDLTRGQMKVNSGFGWEDVSALGSMSLKCFGAQGDDSTDDTSKVSSVINTALSNGCRSVYIPPGTYRISSQISINDVYGFSLKGSARDKCIFKWIGAAGTPMFQIRNSQNVNLESFQIVGNTTVGNRPECAIESISDTGYARTFVPTNNIFRDLVIGTGTANELKYGIKYTNTGTASDTNNSEGIFENVKISGVVEACLYIGHAQSKAHHLRSCEFTGGKYGVYQASGSYTWHGGNCSAMTVAAFYHTSANDVVRLDSVTCESSARLLEVTPAGNAWPVLIFGGRFAADALNADTYAIKIGTKGPNLVKGTIFDTAACKIATNYQTAGGIMVVEECAFNWVSSDVATIFADANQIGTWETKDNVFLDSGGVAAFRDTHVISTEGALHGNTKAAFEIHSTVKGFLPPRMTTTQRNAISSPPAGLVIYNSSTNKLNLYTGAAWEAVTSV